MLKSFKTFMAERGHGVNKLVTGIMKGIQFICLFRVILFKGALFCLPQANPQDHLEEVSPWKKEDHVVSPGLLDDSQMCYLILCKQFLESIGPQKTHIWKFCSLFAERETPGLYLQQWGKCHLNHSWCCCQEKCSDITKHILLNQPDKGHGGLQSYRNGQRSHSFPTSGIFPDELIYWWVRTSPCRFSLHHEGGMIALKGCWDHLFHHGSTNLAKPFTALPSWQWWGSGRWVSINVSCMMHWGSVTMSCCLSGHLFWGSTLPSVMWRGGIQDSKVAIFIQLQGLCLPCQSTHGKPGETTPASLGPVNTHGRWMRSSGLISVSLHILIPQLLCLHWVTLYLLMPRKNMYFSPWWREAGSRGALTLTVACAGSFTFQKCNGKNVKTVSRRLLPQAGIHSLSHQTPRCAAGKRT